MPRPHPDSTLFPYTTLFRSGHTGWAGHSAAAATHLHNSSTVFAPNPAVGRAPNRQDRKSTRLNSSHVAISYAVFCLKKKKHTDNTCTHADPRPEHVPARSCV